MRHAILLAVLSASILIPAPAIAGDAASLEALYGPHRVPRSLSGIKVDGRIDESAWRGALSIDLAYEVRPGENVPPPVRTEALITYDDNAVYFAFRAFDPEPEKIRAHLSDRDRVGPDDWVLVILDTFNDERRSFGLLVNPLGVQSDFIETSTGSDEWDAIWDSAGKIHDWGYAVEIRMPFSSLRFQHSEGPQVWGFDAVRSYPRNVRHHIGTFPRDRSNNCYLCQAVKLVGFEGVTPGRNIEITPTLTSVRTDAREDLDGDFGQGDAEADAGVTARWGITHNMTVSATVNPDFSQVEADELQLDVNEPFAIFFAEKRPFFMEGSDFFSTRLRTVYTRNIRQPSWGLKLTGKEGANTVGSYVVRDDITNLLIPGSQASDATTLEQPSTVGVLRYKRDIGNKLTFGALLTDREGSDYFNRMLSLDGDLRLTDTDRLRVQLLASSTRYPEDVVEEFEQPGGEIKDYAADVIYVHNTRTLDYWALYRDIGEGFRADVGFLPRVDYKLAEAGAAYTWNPEAETWYSYLNLQGWVAKSTDHAGNLLYEEAVVNFQYEGPLQTHAFAQLTTGHEGYNGVEFPRNELYLHNCMKPTASTSPYINIWYGDKVDYDNTRPGKRTRVSPGVFQRIGPHLSVDLSGTWERMRVDSQDLYTARVAETTIAYQFTTRLRFRTTLQYVDYDYNLDLYTDDRDARTQRLFSQLLFSYKINPQTVLFLGYSDASEGNQDYSLTRTDRTFFAKVGYAWTL